MNVRINANDRVIGKSKALLNVTGIVTMVTGTGTKRKYMVNFDNGTTQEVFKRSIAKHGESSTLGPRPMRNAAMANTAITGNDEYDSNEDNSSLISSLDNSDDEEIEGMGR